MDDNELAPLLDDLRFQFNVFGDGLQLLNEKLDAHIEENRREINSIKVSLDQNHLEHQQLIQVIKELDTEVVMLKRVK